jgi:thymidylate synthase
MNNIDQQYKNLLQDILVNGVEKKDRTGTGTISVFGRQIRHKMSEGFPLLTTKKMAWKTMVTELIWFLRGDSDIRFLWENNCSIWDGDWYKQYKTTCSEPYTLEEVKQKVKEGDHYFHDSMFDMGPIYGKQWRQWGGLQDLTDDYKPIYLDQIQNLINELKTNPDSRRLMVSAWNVGELDQMVLPPCHYGFQVYTRELSYNEREQLALSYPHIRELCDVNGPMTPKGWDDYNIPTRAISLMWNQRSVDTFLGLPFNIASYGLLLEIIAKSVNMVPDELIGNLGDTHLYSNHIEQAKEQIDREPFKLPKLNINTEFWPTEGGECGIGLIDANSVFEGFKNEHFCKCLLEDDIQLYGYQSHPAIKAPLSN